MDWLESFIKGVYLPNKAAYSRQCDAALKGAQHAALPVLGKAGNDGRLSIDTINAINEQCGRLKYVSDPLGGLLDYYTHPETTQWALNNNRQDIPCDCDDYAVYAVALARACGIAWDKAWVWNLIINPSNQISQCWANHVICGIEYWDGTRYWTAIIDTNSAARHQPWWFQGDRAAVEQAVIANFSALYKVNYYKLIPVDWPF